MNWRFVNTDFNTGRFNMNFDLQLASELASDEAVLRIYRWKPYCISLGANQRSETLDLKKTEAERLNIVKRPTGGRAILHSEELTYSVIHPVKNISSPKNLYREINLALKKGLENYNTVFSNIELENVQPDFPVLYTENKSTLCFAVSAKNELKFDGKKLVGSAQRKIGKVLLQHGSILCGSFHKKIVDYLMLSEVEREILKSEIENTTTEISKILNEEVDYLRLAESVKSGFEEHFCIKFYQPVPEETII